MKWERLKTIHRTVINTWRRNDGYSIVYIYESKYGVFAAWSCQPNGKWVITEDDIDLLFHHKNKQKVLNFAMKWQKKHRFVGHIKN